MKFEVLANEKLIGYTLLEHGDPPMGVAHGVMTATSGYAAIEALVIAAAGARAAELELTVRIAGAIDPLPCAGVGILDLGVECVEPYVEVLGIPYPEYAELFPQHVAAYAARFSVDGT